jgi:hypothetical protein
MNFSAKLIHESLFSFKINITESKFGGCSLSNKPFGTKVFYIENQNHSSMKRVSLPFKEMSDAMYNELLSNIPKISFERLHSILNEISREHEEKQTLLWNNNESILFFQKSLVFMKSLLTYHRESIPDRILLAELLQKIIFEKHVVKENGLDTTLYIKTHELACEVLKDMSSVVSDSISLKADLRSLSTVEIFKYVCFFGALTILNDCFYCDKHAFRTFLVSKAKEEKEKTSLSADRMNLSEIVNYIDKKITSL